MSEQLTPEEKMPRVGVGLLIIREYEILLGLRRGSHGAGEYGGPGGHLEFGETPEACIKRELAEEAGKNFVITNIAHLCTTNMLKYMPDKHYIDIGMTADWVDGEPEVMEPEKLKHWGWYDFNFLPEPLFGCVSNYIEAKKTGKKYFEAS